MGLPLDEMISAFALSDAVIHPEDKIVIPTSVVKFSEIVGSLYINRSVNSDN